jgi:transcriptional regulator with XRE-family HTH domain
VDVAPKEHREAIAAQVAIILREEREKRSLSMNALAERAGLSQQMVSYVEREMRNPSLETLLRLCGALQLQLSQVLLRAEKRAPQG